MRPILSAALVAMLSIATSVESNPVDEYAALEQQMEAAQEKFSEGGAKGDDRLEILARMDALAEKATAADGGCEPIVQTFRWSAVLDLDRKNLLKRFQKIAPCGGHENIMDALEAVPEVYARDGSVADWVKALEQIKQGAKAAAISANAGLMQGRILLASGDADAARKSFASLIEKHSGSDAAKAAKGYLYEAEHLQIGMIAPDFSAKTLDGRDVSLKSLRGKVVLLDFWATWCGPCLAEIPHIKAAAEKFNDRPFVIVGVSLDDVKEILESTIKHREVPGLQTWDEKGRDNPVGELYNVQELPQSYLLDVDGKIRVRNAFGDALIPAIDGVLPQRVNTPQAIGTENR